MACSPLSAGWPDSAGCIVRLWGGGSRFWSAKDTHVEGMLRECLFIEGVCRGCGILWMLNSDSEYMALEKIFQNFDTLHLVEVARLDVLN